MTELGGTEAAASGPESTHDVVAGIDERFDWAALRKGRAAAADTAAAEARELARMVAAHTIVTEREAVVVEWEERHQTLSSALWSDDVLEGFGLHSSLGAYVLARIAVGWVPSGHTGHRHEALRPEQLVQALVDQGVDETTAHSVVGTWDGVEAGFRPVHRGIDVSTLAGLAERSLMRPEREIALSQVAYSPRCLHRLAATCNLVASVRALLPWLPSPRLGPELSVGFAALALGRGDRVIELFGPSPASLSLLTLVELAEAQWRLERGEEVVLPEDPSVFAIPSESAASPHEIPRPDAEDDVLEIVEERMDEEARLAAGMGALLSPVTRLAKPSMWIPELTPLDDLTLQTWDELLGSVCALVGRRGSLLGFKLPPPPDTVALKPLPPDTGYLRSVLERVGGRDRLRGALLGFGPTLRDSPLEALFPGVRAVLRAICRAAEGIVPSESAVGSAGDFDWLLARARALAKVVVGDLQGAVSAVENLPLTMVPEARWANDRRARFRGRAVEPASVAEARPIAGALVGDLAQQLARTIAGTVPCGNTGEVR